MKTFACMFALALSAASPAAMSCSYATYTPEEKFKSNSVIVLAAPIAVSTSPANALSSSFKGRFQQTVQWQVLVPWKGSYKVGDVFTTMTKHQSGGMCGDGAQHGREIKLLYLSGREPFNDFLDETPGLSIGDLKYLSRKKRGG